MAESRDADDLWQQVCAEADARRNLEKAVIHKARQQVLSNPEHLVFKTNWLFPYLSLVREGILVERHHEMMEFDGLHRLYVTTEPREWPSLRERGKREAEAFQVAA